jgi:hypothetical protein
VGTRFKSCSGRNDLFHLDDPRGGRYKNAPLSSPKKRWASKSGHRRIVPEDRMESINASALED